MSSSDKKGTHTEFCETKKKPTNARLVVLWPPSFVALARNGQIVIQLVILRENESSSIPRHVESVNVALSAANTPDPAKTRKLNFLDENRVLRSDSLNIRIPDGFNAV